MSAPPRLACRGLAVAIAGRTLATQLDLDVRAGEIWAVVGPNGAGKTTLMTTLAGLRPAAAGRIAYDGDDIGTLSHRERALRRGYLPQTTLAGAANLLVLPNLDAANILFNVLKVTSGHGVTVGPILLGAAKPVHVLTPSATVRRVINMTALVGADAASLAA